MLKILTIFTLTILSFTSYGKSNYIDGYYLGFGIGQSTLTPSTSNGIKLTDKHGLANQVILGARINDNISIEISYTNLGNAVVLDNFNNIQTIGYIQKTIGFTYKPISTPLLIFGIKATPFVQYGYRKLSADSSMPATVIDPGEQYIGIGADIVFNEEEDINIRGSYVAYSEDSKSYFFSLIKNW